jgi:threonyl-tRNA synthetase
MGSVERFFGILVEHFAGAFPTWLAPVQAIILTITDAQQDYASRIQQELKAKGFRVEVDGRSEKLGAKIREAQLHKIPHMIVVGGKEQSENKVALRSRREGDLGQMSLESLIAILEKEIRDRL